MRKRIGGLILVLAVLVGGVNPATGAEAPPPAGPGSEQTPARLSFTDGQVSFWRPGATDWTKAQINTPVVPGDELATGSPGTLELQIGARSFIRAWANSQLGLESQEPDFLQVKVTAGTVSLDLRTLESGQTVEVDTPNAAVTLEHTGYYRMAVVGERTSVITRRGGRATVTPASGPTVSMTSSEELVIEGTTSPQMNSYAAPPRDDWDSWNYARTEWHSEAVSARYVPAGVYGVEELDRYGTWRSVPTYGEVWVPTAVPAGWMPYSTGSWVLDPYYGWTWVSSFPWGWAPFHYGRWVRLNGFWAWAPGPIVARPVYAPALVAFFGIPAAGVTVSIGSPLVSWVALGWGEPCVPWWGPVGFVHRPWWGGWGGPRVVNNVVITRTTVVNVETIRVYRNTSVQNAVVVVNREHFGRGPITKVRVTRVDVRRLEPLHTGLPVQATAASFVPTAARGARPSETVLRRTVVATRSPRPWGEPGRERVRPGGRAGVTAPAPRLVTVTRPQEAPAVLSRPTLGQSPIERPRGSRATPSAPPRREKSPRAEARPTGPPAPASRPTSPPASQKPQGTGAGIRAPASEPGRPAAPAPGTAARSQRGQGARSLPGEPASRLAPQRSERPSGQRGGRTESRPSAKRPSGRAGEDQKQPGR
jgi:hypothetical protein